MLDDALPQGTDRLLAVACLEEQRSTFEELLAPHVRDAHIGWIDFEAHADADALVPDALRLLDRRLAEERAALLDRWREERGQHSGRGSDTWEETLAAASDGRVEHLLVLGDDDTPAYECPTCGRGYVTSGACELDGSTLDEAVGGAEGFAIRATLVHGRTVRLLDPEAEDADVAALLRYPQPSYAR